MTDKVPKLLFDALGAIASTQEFVVGCSMAQYIGDNLRNRIIHGYDAVDDEIVYLTVTQDLDALSANLTLLLTARG